MKDGLPFCYRAYPGSVADVVTLDIIVSDLKRMSAAPSRWSWTGGFFSAGNVEPMLDAV